MNERFAAANVEKLGISYLGVRAFLLIGMMFLIAAIVVIGGVACLIKVTGIGLSLDTCFLMATMIFCTLVVSGIAIVLGTNSSHPDLIAAHEEIAGEAMLAALEEEIAERVLANFLNSLETGHVSMHNLQAVVSPEPRRARPKSAANRKRK